MSLKYCSSRETWLSRSVPESSMISQTAPRDCLRSCSRQTGRVVPSGFTRIMKLHWKNQSEVEHEPCRVLQKSIKMWARIDQVWSFYRSSMLPFLFLLSIKCFLYVSLSVENICENLSKNNIEKEISQNVNLSSFFDQNFWICNFCHLCILTSASFFWWIVFLG